MPKQQAAIIVNATRSEVVPVPDIQSLIDRAQVLSQKVDWWNTAMIWAVAFAAIAAIAVGVATWKVVSRSKELGDVQEQLNLVLRGQVATLETRAATAEAELLRLQQQRLPRTLKFESNESLQALIASLKKTPFSAEILYKKGDGEASWFAEQIRGLLLSAEWKVPHPTPIPENVSANAVEGLKAQPDGVTLITKNNSDKDKPDDPEAILTTLLSKSLGVVARSADANLSDNSVKIIILQKP